LGYVYEVGPYGDLPVMPVEYRVDVSNGVPAPPTPPGGAALVVDMGDRVPHVGDTMVTWGDVGHAVAGAVRRRGAGATVRRDVPRLRVTVV
jgi:hypothetical protein